GPDRHGHRNRRRPWRPRIGGLSNARRDPPRGRARRRPPEGHDSGRGPARRAIVEPALSRSARLPLCEIQPAALRPLSLPPQAELRQFVVLAKADPTARNPVVSLAIRR